jgi:transposase-like protein
MAKKRRTFSAEFKLDTVIEGLRGEKTIAQVCREREITDALYYKWRDQFYERAVEIFTDGRQAAQKSNELEGRVAELERLVGRLTLENEILKKARTWLDTQRGRNGG